MLTIEQRLDQLERRNRRLTATLALMVVAICAVVTMAATGEKRGDFDVVTAKEIFVENDDGKVIVAIGANVGGNGIVNTLDFNGKGLVTLTTNENGGYLEVYNKTGQGIVTMYADEYGNGAVYAGNRKGKGRTLKPGP